MKATKFFAIAAIVCGFVMSLASCSSNDVPVYVKPTTTISFESANLNADGYWCGDENGTKFENYGSDAYACSYTEAGMTFPVNYTPSWATWTGFAICVEIILSLGFAWMATYLLWASGLI